MLSVEKCQRLLNRSLIERSRGKEALYSAEEARDLRDILYMLARVHLDIIQRATHGSEEITSSRYLYACVNR